MLINDIRPMCLAWIIIYSVLTLALSCIGLRAVFVYMLKHNTCNLHAIVSNTRFFQTKEERRVCKVVAASLTTAFESNRTHRIVPLQPSFISAETTENGTLNIRMENSEDAPSYWPLFHIAVDGRIINPEVLVSSAAPSYYSLKDLPQPTVSSTMLTSEMMHSSIQPLGVNTSLNRIEQDRNNFGNGYSFGGRQGSDNGVPVDRPLFVNTNMSANQRVDLYRRLSDPPRDSQPALAFRF